LFASGRYGHAPNMIISKRLRRIDALRADATAKLRAWWDRSLR